MPTRDFRPGFRISKADLFVLAATGFAVVYFSTLDRWLGLGIGFVVLHFFLFCNFLRMSRSLELTWAGLFIVLAFCAIILEILSWPMVFTVSCLMTIILSIFQIRLPSYHGIVWQRLNPQLPEWWESNIAKSDSIPHNSN